MIRSLLAAVVAALAAAAGPADASAVPFRAVASGDGAARAEKAAVTRVVRSERAWRAAWRDLHGGGASPSRPRVDFARHMLVLVAAGRRPTGGHAVRVTSVADRGGRLLVRVSERAPGAGCFAAQVETAPWQVVRVRRGSERATSARRRAVVAC